jgi:hypothetical protein
LHAPLFTPIAGTFVAAAELNRRNLGTTTGSNRE